MNATDGRIAQTNINRKKINQAFASARRPTVRLYFTISDRCSFFSGLTLTHTQDGPKSKPLSHYE